jgi:hypothetical protein
MTVSETHQTQKETKPSVLTVGGAVVIDREEILLYKKELRIM